MFSIAFVLLFAVSANALLSTEECMRLNNKELPNEFLVGKWYNIVEFRLFPSPAFCTTCQTANYTMTTESEVEAFKQKHANTVLPFSFDTSPVWYSYVYPYRGALAGDTEVKFFVLAPDGAGVLEGGLPYMTIVHNKINDDFVLRYRCAFSRTVLELISKKYNPSDEEVNAAVDALPSDVKSLPSTRVCCA